MKLSERLGFGTDDRVLILNADDVGSTHASNAAAFECLEGGSLTSASLLVPAGWFPEAAAWARAHPDADIGLHMTLTCEYDGYRWRPLAERSAAPGLYDKEGYLWRTAREAVGHVSPEEAALELRAQVETALAADVDVTHLDTHMGTVIEPKFIDVFVSLGLEYGIPLFVFRPNAERLRRSGYGALWEGLEPQLQRLDAAGFPVLDNVLTQTLGPSPEGKEAFFRDMFANVRPGVTHFLIHPAKLSEETQVLSEDAPSRNRDYELFRDGTMRDYLTGLGIKTITYREVREAYRSGALRS